jgi:hypothetical protein
MGVFHDDWFAVYVRDVRTDSDAPERAERELVRCATYEEAVWIRRENSTRQRKCVIRFVGQAGGGD